MRLLILKLADAAHHTASLSLASDTDAADLVESIEDGLALMAMRRFDVVVLMAGGNIHAANMVLRRLRSISPTVAVVLVSQSQPARSRTFARSEPLRQATIEVNPSDHSVSVDGQVASLSQAEFRLFELLWQRRGYTVTAEQLLEAIYPTGNRPNSRVLPVFLFKLRRKLAAIGMEDMVQTAVGRGFTIPAPDTEAPGQAAVN